MSESPRYKSLEPAETRDGWAADHESLSDEQFLHRFLEPTMWHILDFPTTAWWGHLPFMFATVDLLRPRRFAELGTHYGASFFAAVQAAQRLGFTMEAMAVDSWEGDVHAGEYGNSVYEGFLEVLESRGYSDAVPLKMFFDEAAGLFAPNSVDLLHIDGLHTYEAVKHDYDTWIDSVVPGGLILFHDINVHQRDFGVWRLWNELKEQNPNDRSFAFKHSHGLGVLQKEGDGFPQLTRLLRILNNDQDLAAFTQLIVATVSELAHRSSKLDPTHKALVEQREARATADERGDRLKGSLDSVQASLSSFRTNSDALKEERTQLKTLNAQLEKDAAKLRQDHQANLERLRDDQETAKTNAERRSEEQLAKIAETQAVVRRETDRANREHTAAQTANAEKARTAETNAKLRKTNEDLQTHADRVQVREQLALARAKSAQTRLQAEIAQTLEIVEAQSATLAPPPSKLRRAVRKAKGVPTNPKRSVDTNAVAAGVRVDVFMAELAESGLFDESYYLDNNPDIADYEFGPLHHFVHLGRFEDRQPNEFFSPKRYRNLNKDIKKSGVEATEHYLKFGSNELRRIGGGFNSPAYLFAHKEVAKAGANSLGHYLRVGRAKGWSPTGPVAEETNAPAVDRRRRWVDKVQERRTTEALLASYKGQRDKIDDTLVSIVMPTYNRANVLPKAFASVQAQTHQNWELIIVDDGSTDETKSVVDRLSRDSRVRFIANDHGGVSRARNSGLEAATGDFVAYLDTDNEWTPEYLRFMLTHFANTKAKSGYAGMVLVNDEGTTTRYLGSDFDWNACFADNYVDMNVFMHRRNARGSEEASLRFEPRLKRMVDWDFILRMTRDEPATHAPFVGCRYHDSDNRVDRITKSEPVIYRDLVRLRNDPQAEQMPTFAELSKSLTLEFAIRISAPWTQRHLWGDTHYAIGLQEAIEQLGHKARIVYHDDPAHMNKGPLEEVNLVLRGLTPHGPVPNGLNILWVISHPEAVSAEEMAGYNIVYVASESHAALLQHDPLVNPRVLMQATGFEPAAPKDSGGLVFVGNTRKVERPIVEWAADEDLDLRLFGVGWENTPAADHCLGTSYPNEYLPELYASADAVLNDHWESMREFGYISNRVFDVLAAGGSVISDGMPAIDRFFGDAVAQISSRSELGDAAQNKSHIPERDRVAASVRSDHSFHTRARQIINDVFASLNLDQPYDPDIGGWQPWNPTEASSTSSLTMPSPASPGTGEPLKIGVLASGDRSGYDAPAFARVLSPLTGESAFSAVRVFSVDDPKSLDVDALDAVVVSGKAASDIGAANKLIASVRDAGAVLLVDVDHSDDPSESASEADEQEVARIGALAHLIGEADAITVPTANVAKALGIEGDARASVIPDALDPRLWRRYPRPDQVQQRDPKAKLRLVYIADDEYDDDFEIVVDALDEWAKTEDFELTVIGDVPELSARPWIRRLAAPKHLWLYPRFTRWLVDQPQFDIGLAPLQDTEFNAERSDARFLDYCAIGAVPVLSKVDAYAGDSHTNGLAYHAKAKTESWVKALTKAAAEVREGARVDERRAWLWENRNASQAGQQLIDLIAELGATAAE